MAGGAITAKSIPKEEYEECLVKVKAILEIVSEEKGPLILISLSINFLIIGCKNICLGRRITPR